MSSTLFHCCTILPFKCLTLSLLTDLDEMNQEISFGMRLSKTVVFMKSIRVPLYLRVKA